MSRHGNPLENLHAALASAAYKDFDEHEYQDRDWKSKDPQARVTKRRRPTDYDIGVVAMFPQTWGSTALGFGGVGGQAITTAYTIVLENGLDGQHAVYFGGRFAYKVKRPNALFWEHVGDLRLAAVGADVKKYEETE